MVISENEGRWKRIGAFLLLTTALSAIAQVAIVRGGGLALNSWLVFGLMWCPGIAAVLTQLWFRRSIGTFGWKLPRLRYAALAYVLPIAYALPVYGLVWSAGFGAIASPDAVRTIAGDMGIVALDPWVFVRHAAVVGSVGVLTGMAFALGEEIGWRGFLVPELAGAMPFHAAALGSGVIWALWHYPLLLWADYNGGVPAWYAIPCFTIMVVGIGYAMAWLRLRSASLWPSVILHASHNAWIQQFFTPITVDTSIAKYWIDEFGIGLAISCAIVGFIFYRRSGLLQPIDLASGTN